jgi:hypothetical protein
MRISSRAQRSFRQSHAEEYARHLDLEALGFLVVNWRDGHWWVVDGQHRKAALELIGWGDQQMQCEAYDGLTEEEEAELFLKRNKRREVRAFDKFRVAVIAEREVECDVERIVLLNELKVSESSDDGCIGAVTALTNLYVQAGAAILARTLRILREAYAKDHEAFRGEMIKGTGLVVARYNGQLDDTQAMNKLSRLPGGALGLRAKAATTQKATGRTLAECIAATVVDTVNQGVNARNARLQSWWK